VVAMARAENKNAGLLAKHEDVVVIGLGLTGYSVVRYLAALGKNIQVLDTRKVAPFSEQLRQAYPDIPIYQGALDEDIPARILRNAKFLVVSPGVSIRHPELAAARARGADLVGDIELFSENNSQPVAAITGSNGKSTVTVLVGEILESAGKDPLVGGNIGLPVLDAVTESTAYKSVVLELSSFQLETTYSLASHVAAILNVSADPSLTD
jgi:UDP-N-acetylmuramoylalanine--D-glutamate ligase